MKGYQLTVYGNAEPAGSKRAFYVPKLKRAVVTDANPRSRSWKDLVSQEAGKITTGLLEGPLRLEATFYRPRPAMHFGKGRNAGVLKASAPPYPTTRPDATKLLRGIEDALTGVLYRDDAQIVRQSVWKDWGEPARVVIRIEEIGDLQAEPLLGGRSGGEGYTDRLVKSAESAPRKAHGQSFQRAGRS